MNYKHIYHAGSFSDVFKHALLIELLKTFWRKDTAFCYLDTHAGSGLYDLMSAIPQKTHEYDSGIKRLMQYSPIPNCLKDYLQTVIECEPDNLKNNHLHFYPGSPLVALTYLRPQDRMMLNERQLDEFLKLKDLFQRERQVSCFEHDAYLALKALLPPKEKRGLILIDPPFEERTEFLNIINGLKEALTRFETGVYAIWYPIKDRYPVDQFYRKLSALSVKNVLAAEFMVFPAETSVMGLNGCGLAVINPPWQIERQFEPILQALVKILGKQDQGHYQLKWLKHESK